MLDLDGDVCPDGIRALENLIASGFCASAEYCQTIPSTNTQALLAIRESKLDDSILPRCYLADEQTAGRGRHGRSWVSDEGTLTFSLVVSRSIDDLKQIQFLPLAVGLGIARLIEFEFAPVQAKLKWPNDVNVGGGKVAGVLLETTAESPDMTVIGVGINVSSDPSLEENQLGITTRSLTQIAGRRISRYEILEPLVESIITAIDESLVSPANFVQEFRGRCLLTGREITFRHRDAEKSGLCQGIADDGTLLVKTSEGTQVVSSGETRLVRFVKP